MMAHESGMTTTSEFDLMTRRSLLSRLRDLDNRESWRTFFDLYWRMLYNMARRTGLSEADAQDVVQQTVVMVARQMPAFHYDPARGKFKNWLFRIVRRRVADHLRRIYREPVEERLAHDPPDADEDAPDAGEDAVAGEFGAAWEQEWEQTVLEAAVARVRSQVNPKHFQVFDYCVRQGWPAAKVAATLSMNAAQVYLARHRVSHAVKVAGRAISAEWQRGEFSPAEKPPPFA
jgi:RNA polymerase sigma factor (sigma-70 family)